MAQLAKQYQIPIYPGAVPDTAHFSTTASAGREYLAYTTVDPPDRVVSFYKGNMGLGVSTSGAVTMLQGSTHDGSAVTINVGQKMDGSGTSFAIVITPLQPQQTYASNAVPAATATPQMNTPVPPAAWAKDTMTTTPADNQTYYVTTSNSPDDNSNTNSDDNSDGQQSGDTSGNTQQSDTQGQGSQDQQGQQGQDNGPPGG